MELLLIGLMVGFFVGLAIGWIGGRLAGIGEGRYRERQRIERRYATGPPGVPQPPSRGFQMRPEELEADSMAEFVEDRPRAVRLMPGQVRREIGPGVRRP